MNVYWYRPNGKIEQAAYNLPAEEADAQVGNGLEMLLTEDAYWNVSRYYVADGAIVAMPPRPSEDYEWDYSANVWIDPRTLAEHKALRRQYLKDAALAAANADLTVSTVTFAVSLDIRAELAQELALAQAEGASYSLEWERAGGTPITLTGVQVKNLLRAMSTRATGIRSTLRTKLAAVAAAATKAEVESVQW